MMENKNLMKIKYSKGFTLVELLVVIAIIGLLAAVVIVALGPTRARARDSRRIADLKSITTAIEIYKNDNNGAAPTTAQGLIVLVPSYLGAVPADPLTGSSYTITNAGATPTYYVQITTEETTTFNPAGSTGSRILCGNSAGIEATATATTPCGAANEK